MGNDLSSDQIAGRSGIKSNDSIAATGTAKMAWGIASKQAGIFGMGYNAYLRALPYVLNNIGNPRLHSYHRGVLSNLEEYNINLQHLVDGATMLETAGIDGYGISYKDNTLRDAVVWFANHLNTNPIGFRHYRVSSHNWHVGWIATYATIFPNAPETKILHGLLERRFTWGSSWGSLKKGQNVINAQNIGGPTFCLYGYNAPK